MLKNKVAVAVVGNFKYLNKYFPIFFKNLTEKGKYTGDVIVLTSIYTPTFLIRKLYKNKNIEILRFKEIKFSKKIRNRYLKLNTGDQPNRFKSKKFQWFKLNLFHPKLKKWDKILYLDINLTIHHEINELFNLNFTNKLLAKADGYPDYTRTLASQFDINQPEINDLENIYNLQDDKYFQTGFLLYDTNLINDELIDDIYKLAVKYPISKTNEQGILNLYFSNNEHKYYEELPEYIGDKIIYYYWMNKEKNIIITKQLSEQYK